MFMLIIRMVTCFTATTKTCRLVATYYSKLEGESAKSTTTCVIVSSIYYVWFAVCIATIIIRIFAFQYLWRSYRFLLRKKRDKDKRKEHELEKKRKDRRRRKRAM